MRSSSLVMPAPVSCTVMTRSPAFDPVVTVTRPPLGVNFRALDSRFSMIWRSALRSALTVSGDSAVSTFRSMPVSSARSLTSFTAEAVTSRASNSSRRRS